MHFRSTGKSRTGQKPSSVAFRWWCLAFSAHASYNVELLKVYEWCIICVTLECWQLTCQFPTWRSPVLGSFDRDNSMYEQQKWMLTLGLLNRNTGCQCCSVRCSSMLKLLCKSIYMPNLSLDFQNFNFSTVRTVKRVELHHCAKFRRNRLNCSRDMVVFRFLRWRPPPSWIFKIFNVRNGQEGQTA